MSRGASSAVSVMFLLSAAAGPAQDVDPVQTGESWRLQSGRVSLEVRPASGGRVAAFGRDGIELLTGPEVDAVNWGSTFWPSPQSAWSEGVWPPPAEIDGHPYDVVDTSGRLALEGPTHAATGLRATKDVRMDAAGRVTVRYTLERAGQGTGRVAPWEVTRVPARGVVLFDLGPGGLLRESPVFRVRSGVAWSAVPPSARPERNKTLADGRGWLAWADERTRLLFVKSFRDVDPDDFAPGEAEVEIYFSPGDDYIELENQGAWRDVEPDAALEWTVTWEVRPVPDGIEIAEGSEALVGLVRDVLAGRPPN